MCVCACCPDRLFDERLHERRCLHLFEEMRVSRADLDARDLVEHQQRAHDRAQNLQRLLGLLRLGLGRATTKQREGEQGTNGEGERIER